MVAPIDARSITHNASQAVMLTRQALREREAKKHQTLTFPTPNLSKYLIPMWPGELVIVCGRPQNYKTGLMQTLMYDATMKIMNTNQPLENKQCTVFVTWEVSVEQATAYWLAIYSQISATEMMKGELTTEQWGDLDAAMMQVGAMPMYIIGHSTARDAGKRKRPQLSPENVSAALDYLMNDLEREPTLITMDYLQRMHNTKALPAQQHYTYCVDWAKDTALQSGCPVVLGSQAGRQVDEYQFKMPKLNDSQWSSNAEQSADKFLSVWMPKTAGLIGQDISWPGGSAEVTERLLLLSVAKQKYGPAGQIFPLYIEPEYLKMGDLHR